MATRLIGVDSADPKLPDVVIEATSYTGDSGNVLLDVDPADPRLPDDVVDAGFSKVLLDVLDPSGARYAVRQNLNSFESGTYYDTTMNIGYNVSTTPGVKADPDEPMLFLQWESKFRNSPVTPYLAEFHLNFNGTNPALTGLLRPIALTIEHETHIVDLTLVADTFKITDHDANQLINFGSGSWYAHKPVVISVGASAASSLTIGEAGHNANLIFNCGAANTNQINWFRNGVSSWLIYDAASTSMIIRDAVNAKAHITLVPGATAAAAYTDFQSHIRVFGGQGEFGPTTTNAVVGSFGGVPGLEARGSTTNISMGIKAKGTGVIISSSPHRFDFNVGFNAATPVAKSTGWGAPTGTATKTTFATTTVTTEELAERVKALVDYLTTRGDIGA